MRIKAKTALPELGVEKDAVYDTEYSFFSQQAKVNGKWLSRITIEQNFIIIDDEQVARCQYCSGLTDATSLKVCLSCWEVKTRLAEFLRGGQKALDFVAKKLDEALARSRK